MSAKYQVSYAPNLEALQELVNNFAGEGWEVLTMTHALSPEKGGVIYTVLFKHSKSELLK